MARYKEYDYTQGKIIPIHFDKQILPGTFEYSLHYLIDNEIDLSIFGLRYWNDETGHLPMILRFFSRSFFMLTLLGSLPA